MGVAPEVGEDLLWPREWTLGVDDPVFIEQSVTQGGEVRAEIVVGTEVESLSLMGLFEQSDEFAPEKRRDDLDGEQVLAARVDPLVRVEGQTTIGDDAVKVGMKAPSVIVPWVRKSRLVILFIRITDVNWKWCAYHDVRMDTSRWSIRRVFG